MIFVVIKKSVTRTFGEHLRVMKPPADAGGSWSRVCETSVDSPTNPRKGVRNMSAARRLSLLLSLFVLLAGVATSVAQEDTIEIALGWAASPLIDENGDPLAPAVSYRLYATRDGGPLTYLAEVVGDTVCTIELLRGATYRVRVVGFDAESRPSVPSEFSDPIYYAPGGDLTDVDDLPASGAAIESTYPNPFNPLIRVRYAG